VSADRPAVAGSDTTAGDEDGSVVTIGRRFNGPPDSANGGYACGVTAAALGDGPVEVTLRRPPPVDQPLRVVAAGGGERAELYDGDQLVAEAVATVLHGGGGVDGMPAPVSFAAAQKAAEGFDVDQYTGAHPFPTCFSCGPERAVGDGLRVFPAAFAPGQVVWPWVPGAELAGRDGRIDPVLLWAVLDCPSALAWFHDQPPVGPHVLGRMAAEIVRRPAPGEQLVVGGWLSAVDGRKRFSGAAIWAGDEVVAHSRATWIALTDRSRATFSPA
jgi:hypothetical protein